MTRRERSMRGSRSVSPTASFWPFGDPDGNQRETQLEVEIEVVDDRFVPVVPGAPGEPEHGGGGCERDPDRDDAGDVEGVGERRGRAGRDGRPSLRGVR